MLTSEQFSTKYPDATTVTINSDLALAIASESESDLEQVCKQLQIDVESIQAKLFYLKLGQKGDFVVIFEDGYQSQGYCELSDTQGNLLKLGFIPADGQKPIEYIEFTIGSHFLSALINGDYTGLDCAETTLLKRFIQVELETDGYWYYDLSEPYFGYCDVVCDWSNTVDLLWIKR